MKTKLALALVLAALGGCAVVPVGYDEDYGYGYHRHYRGDRYDRDNYYHRDRWLGRSWRDDDRDRFYSGSITYRNWDHGQ
jgi:hypothetical protein